jgi:hypothetical protein
MSVTELPDARSAGPGTTRQRLLLIWQDPTTRRFAPVGVLVQDPDGSFVFRYIRRALREAAFHPLASFPSLRRVYRFADLPPFFHNRVMSPRRPDYPAYVRALHLSEDQAPPFEVLARTGGSRATDTFHVVAEPAADPDGKVRTLFLASGVRWVPGADERISRLSTGDRLTLRPAPDNPHNSLALLLDADDGQAVGYVPDWMLDVVRSFAEADPAHRLTVEQANGPGTAPHLRLLCRFEATVPAELLPRQDPDFDYVPAEPS